MANQQTKSFHPLGVSVTNCGDSPGFKEFPLGSQPSKRTKKWQPAIKSDRPIIYLPEHSNRVKK